MANSSARPEKCYWCGEKATYNKQGFASPFWGMFCERSERGVRWYDLCPACTKKKQAEKEGKV